MAQVVGTVVSISLETDVKKQAGGTYKGWQLVYNADGEIRTEAKPVTSLKFNRALADQLAALNVGDEFTLTKEKNDSGFYDVKSVVKGRAEVDIPAAPQSKGVPNTGGATRATGSTYETPQERAVRQRLIVRQSSLSAAIEILKEDKKTPLNLENATALADSLTQWVFEVQGGKDAAMQNIQDLGDDIPM